jgi:hypothetical protein
LQIQSVIIKIISLLLVALAARLVLPE